MLALGLIGHAWACGSDAAQPPSSGGGGGLTPPAASRLAWSQAAPSLVTAQAYQFVLFVDGARNDVGRAACTGGASPYDCSTPLPPLAPGPHTLELSARDTVSGAESERSAPLTVGQQAVVVPANPSDGLRLETGADTSLPSVTCAAGDASSCFTTRRAAAGLAPVRRVISLPGDRTLLLHENGRITFLPSGTSERPELGRAEPGVNVEIADVAADPDFAANRFLYFATVAAAPGGNRRVDVFRARELADRVGEAAMIVSLPASPAGRPALAAAPDHRLYVAMPSAGAPAFDRPYDGRVLRFTRDGAAAGHERTGSPILATGSSRPASLAWSTASRLLMASEDSREPRLVVVALSQYSQSTAWPVAAVPVVSANAAVPGGVRAMAIGRAAAERAGNDTLAIIATDPQGLYLATIAADEPFELATPRHLPLGPFVPTAAAFSAAGDLLVAGTFGNAAPAAELLQLRRR